MAKLPFLPTTEFVGSKRAMSISEAVHRILLVAFAAVAVQSWQVASAASPDTTLAGVAKVDITPDTPVRMYGYASRKAESEGIAGPLSAGAGDRRQ